MSGELVPGDIGAARPPLHTTTLTEAEAIAFGGQFGLTAFPGSSHQPHRTPKERVRLAGVGLESLKARGIVRTVAQGGWPQLDPISGVIATALFAWDVLVEVDLLTPGLHDRVAYAILPALSLRTHWAGGSLSLEVIATDDVRGRLLADLSLPPDEAFEPASTTVSKASLRLDRAVLRRSEARPDGPAPEGAGGRHLVRVVRVGITTLRPVAQARQIAWMDRAADGLWVVVEPSTPGDVEALETSELTLRRTSGRDVWGWLAEHLSAAQDDPGGQSPEGATRGAA